MSGNFESKLGEDDFWGAVEAAAISYGANFSEKTAAEFRSLSRSMKNFAMELGGRAELAKSYLENLNSLSSSIYDDLSSVDRSKYSSEVLRNVDRYTASAKMSEDLLASASRMESSAFVFEQIGRHVGNTFVGLTILATLSKPGATAAEVAEVAFPLAMSMLGVALASAIAVLPALDLAIIGIGMGIAGKLAWDGLLDALGVTGKNSPPFWDFLSSFFDFNKEKQVSDYAKAIAIILGKSMTDPLVMDLSGGGIQLISEGESKAYFDLHGTGFAVHTGWIGPQTGFLARANESGAVTSVSDLFGSDEIDGFSALAALDANGDGVVNLSDPGFYDLCVWVDVNGNGVSDPGELHSLQELGIVAINLETENSKRKVGGNLVAEAATFVKSDGSTGEIVEAYFDNNPVNSKFKGNFSLNPEVLDLPNLRGYGTLTDLSVAMSVDPDLLGMVKKFLKGVIDDVPDFHTRVSAIVFQWAGVSGVDPDSRGRFVDARKLEVVEKFSGQGFGGGRAGAGTENPWNYFQANAINQAFDTLLSAVGARLLLQGPLKTCFEGISFDYYSDSFIGNFDPDEAGRKLMNSMSGEVEECGDEIAYLTRIFAVGLDGGFDEFIPVFQYIFRELDLKYTVEEAARGHVIIEGGVLGGTATNGSISLSRDGGAYYVDGGPGVDEIYGSGGADTFIFNQGYGRLRIYENQSTDLSSGTLLKLGKGLDPSTITVTTNNGDVIIRQGTDRITLPNMANYPDHYGVSQVQFADGTIWTAEELVAKARFVNGTSENDSLDGSFHGDVFDGKGGNDEIYGRGGADTFIFNQGYGRLRIYENQSTDLSSGTVLKLGKGLNPSTITVTTNSGDVIIRQGTDRITLSNMADYPDHYGVSQVQFADGTIWTAEELVAKARFVNGTSENDSLDGSFHGDVFDGKGGNDEIYGRGGADTFIFNQGYGRLRIYENQSTDLSSGTVLKLGKGLDPSTVTVTTNSGDVIIRQGTDRITLSNMANYPDHYGVSQVQFADGTVWTAEELVAKARFINGTSENDSLDGSLHGEVFDGKGGADTIYGGGGADTFIFNQGYGRLWIYENQSTDLSSGTILKLGKGLAPSTVTVTTNNGDVIIRQGTDRITLPNMANYPDHYGVSQVQFADGTIWTAKELVAKARFINGTSESDSLDGSLHGEVFDGKGGADTIYGGGGADTFIFNQGYGRLWIYENQSTDLSSGTILKLGKGLAPSTITVTTNNGDVVIRQGTDRITLSSMANYPDRYGVSQVQFADGTIWTAEELVAKARFINGTSENDSLDGSLHGEVFDGKGGADTIYGGGGADTFIFNQGYGRLRIYENQSTDLSSGTVLKLGKGLNPSTITVTTNSGDVIIRQGTDRITLSNMADYPDHYGVSQVQFADGTIWTAEQLINLARGIEARPALISLYAVSDDAFPDTMLPNARFAPIEGDNTASSHELSMENAKSDTQLNQLVDAMASYTGSNRGCVDMALSGRSIDDRSPMLATYAEK